MASLMNPANLPPPSEATPYSFSDAVSSAPNQHAFYPYTDNGGSTLGIAGSDFTILAGDTRSTSGYNINTRLAPKLFHINPGDPNSRLVLSVVGYAADGHALRDRLEAIVKTYRYQHNKTMGVKAAAARLSTILYSKRFFPYYVHAILAGIDESGRGALYSYDPVGSYEREHARAAGAAASLIMPFLDNQVNFKNQYLPSSDTDPADTHLSAAQRIEAQKPRPVHDLDQTTVEQLVKDAFTSATERHIEVGDGLQMVTITKDGVTETYTPLKRD